MPSKTESQSNHHAKLPMHRWIALVVVTVVIAIGCWLIRDLEHHLSNLESWISAMGWRGWVVFVVMTAALTSVFVPDTVFAVVAGALFGWLGGTCLMIVALFCSAPLQFLIARRLLHHRVQSAIARRPRLALLQRVVNEEGLRFQFLLRLTPLNPVLISYLLGASRSQFSTFAAALTGLIPMLALEVYFGKVAGNAVNMMAGRHEPDSQRILVVVIGLITCIALLVYVSNLAKRALKGYTDRERESGQPEHASNTTLS
jgi:uncharacterized membrane protein YdjX (TVP38/TMEM64 family)